MNRLIRRIYVISFVISVSLIISGLGIAKTFRQDGITVTSLRQWLVGHMISWRPPGRSVIPEAKETPEEGKTRYEKIGNAMINVVYDPRESPIFTGKYGRARTLALLASISFFESGWRKDVDLGIGKIGRGDSGRSWCMMQIMLGRPDNTGYTRRRILLTKNYFRFVGRNNKDWKNAFGGRDLVQNREDCFRAGLHLIRNSFRSCQRLPIIDRLSVYTSGSCSSGTRASEVRVRMAQRMLAIKRPPITDIGVMRLLHPNIFKSISTQDSETSSFHDSLRQTAIANR